MENRQVLQTYISGAAIAFGTPLVLSEIFGLFWGMALIDGRDGVYSSIYFLIHLIGGVIGGALVTRKIHGQKMKNGLVPGLIAYALNQLVYSYFYSINALGDPYTFFSLVGGSLIGAYIDPFKPPS